MSEKIKHKKHKNCDCDDTCNCHDENGNCTCEDDCTCRDENGKCTCEDDCNCKKEKDCGCHGEGGDNCTCGDHCDCDHGMTAEEVQKVFNELQNAIVEADKEIKKTREEMLNNQRIAVSYKKDLERYKERNKNIETEAKDAATENVAVQIIPIIDQFERALAVPQNDDIKKGYNMIYASLVKMVEGLGISEIEALGKDFDSNFHSAVSKIQTKDKSKNGKVTTVYQKGYKLNSNNKIIRYAMVEVSEYTK